MDAHFACQLFVRQAIVPAGQAAFSIRDEFLGLRRTAA
jgi:hypothetical protein